MTMLALLLLGALGATSGQPSHTCRAADDCISRLGAKYPALTFLCCTTVVCNEVYGYYTVSSGCATEWNCKPETQVHGATRFAARLHTEDWLERETRLFGDCEATRGAFGPPGATQFSIEPLPANPDEGRCASLQPICASAGQACCVQVNCRVYDHPNQNFYRKKDLCLRRCNLRMRKEGNLYTFTFRPSDWARRAIYQDEMLAGPPELSCTETRYFYFWSRDAGRRRLR